MRRVAVTAERSGRWWALSCAEAGSFSQCRSLAQVDDEMREAIAFQLNVGRDEFAIDVDVVVPDAYRKALQHAEQLQEQAAATAQRSRLAHAKVAKDLAAANMSVRDIGQVMGVSPRRARQLVTS